MKIFTYFSAVFQNTENFTKAGQIVPYLSFIQKIHVLQTCVYLRICPLNHEKFEIWFSYSWYECALNYSKYSIISE